LNKIPLLIFVLCLGCQTGNLSVIADLPNSLKETSAVEVIGNSNLIWVIEDAGNKNVLSGLNTNGKIVKEIKITNAKNTDWEELASDSLGNIYIGDFGNNSKNRNSFRILKVEDPEESAAEISSKHINFTLPEDIKTQDFEAFFLMRGFFYIFSKSKKHGKLFRVPNRIGDHEAVFITNFNLKGKNNAITSADHYNSKIVLLNHDKVWLLSNFTGDAFFDGDIEVLEFNHKSQKEGVCFKNDSILVITDEYANKDGGNIYEFDLIKN